MVQGHNVLRLFGRRQARTSKPRNQKPCTRRGTETARLCRLYAVPWPSYRWPTRFSAVLTNSTWGFSGFRVYMAYVFSLEDLSQERLQVRLRWGLS